MHFYCLFIGKKLHEFVNFIDFMYIFWAQTVLISPIHILLPWTNVCDNFVEPTISRTSAYDWYNILLKMCQELYAIIFWYIAWFSWYYLLLQGKFRNCEPYIFSNSSINVPFQYICSWNVCICYFDSRPQK